MKPNSRLLPLLAFSLLISFGACTKNNSENNSSDPSAEVQAHSEDQNNVSTQIDAISDDASLALESEAYFSARTQNTTGVCGAVAVADTISSPKTITITYDGPNCAGTHHRSGTVVLTMAAGNRWRNPGAKITVAIQRLKIKRLSDNKTITLNGTKTLTNVSGGLLIHLPNRQSIVHTITSDNMSITFDDNTQRTWNVAHKRTFTYNNGVVLTATGIGVTGGLTNATEWGTNRFGHPFTTSVTSPFIFRQDCSGRLTSGEVKHEGFATSVATFGLDASGAVATCPGTGKYYYKLVWTGPNGNSRSVIRPY